MRPGTGGERSGERYAYDIRREDAQRAALQAALLAKDDPERLQTVQSVLDGLHATTSTSRRRWRPGGGGTSRWRRCRRTASGGTGRRPT